MKYAQSKSNQVFLFEKFSVQEEKKREDQESSFEPRSNFLTFEVFSGKKLIFEKAAFKG